MSCPHLGARIFGVLLLACFALVAFTTAKRGLADATAQEPRYLFKRWQEGKSNLDTAAAAALETGLTAALNLDPGNPDLLSDLGRLVSWRVRGRPSHDSNAFASRERALARLRQAAWLRPTSGHSWVNVAVTKFSLGLVDSEFIAALEQTQRYAPWEPKVQLISIELGLASWPALTKPMQREIASAVHTQAGWPLVNQKPALIQMLKRYRRNDLACPWAGAAFPCQAA